MADVFRCHLNWVGGASGPTTNPAEFSRDLHVSFEGGPGLEMSAAPGYRGDPTRANPEQLLVASLSACQALTYLYLAARAGVPIARYEDDPEGRLGLADGRLRMTRVTLRPAITLAAGASEAAAREIIEPAHRQCFVANSVTTAVTIEPTFRAAE
ncbi:MAG TPA: OsmC family protein [Vicinamibacterales bacterium]|nr:OsmC family protein [Vicinamibacterales bacterium]